MQIQLTNDRKIEIYVEIMGEGAPILFLHGGPGCCHESFAPFFKPLAQEHQVIYYDQIGCGKSDWNVDYEYKIEYELEVIEAIRKKLGYDKITIVGESWGTYLALQYASVHSECVKSLILLSSVGFNKQHLNLFGSLLYSKITDKDKALITSIEQMMEVTKIMSSQQAGKAVQDIFNKYYLDDPDNLSKVIDQPINFEQNNRVVNLFQEQLDFIKRTDILKHVNIHMYQAEGDIMTPDLIESNLVSLITPNSFVRVPDCGHWIYLEQTEFINNEITKIVSMQ